MGYWPSKGRPPRQRMQAPGPPVVSGGRRWTAAGAARFFAIFVAFFDVRFLAGRDLRGADFFLVGMGRNHLGGRLRADAVIMAERVRTVISAKRPLRAKRERPYALHSLTTNSVS